MRMRGSLFAPWTYSAFLVATVFLGSIGSAQAQQVRKAAESQDDEMARTLFETGRAYFERAQYAEASAAFAKAYRLSGRPPLLINQARALEAGGEVGEAIEVLERFEEVAPEDEPLRSTVTAMLRRLRAAAERQAAASDDESGTPAEADATLVPPGAADLAAADDDHHRGAMWWSGMGAFSLAGLSGVVALGTGIAARRTHSSLESDCPLDQCPPELQGDIDRGRRLAVTSTVFTFVGIGSAVAGALLLFLGRDRTDTPEPRVQVTGGPGTVGSGLRLRF
jgi:tetratricopeptide (TPR) repeat protein